jgi:eukaryotic-like serine/threonine-protein kinase
MESRRVEPRHTTSGSTDRYGLPHDVIVTAVRRLGFLGVVIALMGPSAYVFELFTQPARIRSGGYLPLTSALALLVSGMAVCVCAWRQKVGPELMLDIGLLFQVFVSFALALNEGSSQFPREYWVNGVSWICLWITVYVVAIPGTTGKMVCAAVASACMLPFGWLVATTVNDHQLPLGSQMLSLMLPPFAAAFWAIPVGRYLYRLGTQVSKARAMGSYELVELLGRGGMGEVWRARHRMLARMAAIKLIRPQAFGLDTGADPGVLQKRFEREAMATAGLRSPHTVVLYDYGTSEDGTFYYVMELLDGLDLQQLVSDFGPQPAGRVLHFLQQTAKSLAEAHENGLIHRDIKPSNIFCCRMGIECDYVKVLDFGLVKVRCPQDQETQLTRAGMTTGTPAYMAPEAAGGCDEVDERSDLYSLGCVAYWLLTGHLVFDKSGQMAQAMAHLQTPPTPPSSRTELPIPGDVDRLVMACLEKHPGLRPQSARELASLVEACQAKCPWTPTDAERWWQSHVPSGRQVGSELSSPTVLMPSEVFRR